VTDGQAQKDRTAACRTKGLIGKSAEPQLLVIAGVPEHFCQSGGTKEVGSDDGRSLRRTRRAGQFLGKVKVCCFY